MKNKAWKIDITLTTDTPAFDKHCGKEVGRILKEMAKDISRTPNPRGGLYHACLGLRDKDGYIIGHYEINEI